MEINSLFTSSQVEIKCFCDSVLLGTARNSSFGTPIHSHRLLPAFKSTNLPTAGNNNGRKGAIKRRLKYTSSELKR